MTNVLTINGKEYIQSNRLARKFGYTTDYIGRLAREEKILATQVDRQWFVEPESLRIFAHQAQVEKKIRSEELRQQRKFEQLARTVQQTPVRQTNAAALALAQLFLILACGAFVGGLGWVATSEGLTMRDLQAGGTAIALLAFEAFDPAPHHALYTEAIFPQDVADLSIPATNTPATEELRFAELPVFPSRTELGTASSSANTVLQHFSDEVEVVLDENGNQMVRPIFREDSDSSDRFLLVPVSGSTN